MHYCRLTAGGDWEVCEDDGWSYAERSVWTAGPAERVMTDAPVAVVVGAMGPGNLSAVYMDVAMRLQQDMLLQGRFSLTIRLDTDLTACIPAGRSMGHSMPVEAEATPPNLVLLGGPAHNLCSKLLHNKGMDDSKHA